MTRTLVQDLLRVIEGGGAARTAAEYIAVPAAPNMCAAELAADMAEIFALGLVQEVRPEALTDPHCAVRVDGATRFTMHELLCELRNLSWFDARTPLSPSGPAASRSPAGRGDADHRRRLRLNDDGQLTLSSLMRGGVALRGGGPVLSAFWDCDHQVATGLDPSEGWPDEAAPMSEWLGWCALQSRAGLRLPGVHRPSAASRCLGDRAEALHDSPPARPFHNAALVTLAQGTGMDEGLPDGGSWTGQRLMSLMAEAEALARRISLHQAGRPNRMPRPAVTAARMTVWLGREERTQDAHGATYREAVQELAAAAPNLMHWVSRANRARRGPQRFETSLFLPLATPERQHLTPADIASHAIVAGALATLLKAVFDTSRRAQLHMVGTNGPDLAMEDQADRLAANVSVMRCVSGGYFPAENHQDLRLGQSIALHLLRQRLELDNRSASLSLRDFDGQNMQIQSHPRHFGKGHATLLCDGAPVVWPQEAGNPAAHLTEVV